MTNPKRVLSSMRRSSLLALSLSLCLPVLADGQEVRLDDLTPESRVRLMSNEDVLVDGRWAGIDDRGRLAVYREGSTLAFEPGRIDRIERWRPTPLHGALEGALHGLVIGAVLGFGLDVAYSEDQLGEFTFYLGAVGTVPGAVIGTIVGQVRGAWDRVEMP